MGFDAWGLGFRVLRCFKVQSSRSLDSDSVASAQGSERGRL